MNELARLINIYWRRLLWPLAKYTLIFLGVSTVSFFLTTNVVLPVLTKDSSDPDKVSVRKNSGGRSLTVFGKDKVPASLDEELDVPAQQLIFQNQSRYYELTDPEAEDRASGPVVQAGERRRIERATSRFLTTWETYRPGDRLSDYAERLAPLTTPTGLNAISTRVDNRQPAAIGIDGVAGSTADRMKQYVPNLRILRYDGSSAYVALTAPVMYTGPAQVWSGRSFQRTYGLVLRREGQRWLVARAAAQTLGEVEHFEPGPPPAPKS